MGEPPHDEAYYEALRTLASIADRLAGVPQIYATPPDCTLSIVAHLSNENFPTEESAKAEMLRSASEIEGIRDVGFTTFGRTKWPDKNGHHLWYATLHAKKDG